MINSIKEASFFNVYLTRKGEMFLPLVGDMIALSKSSSRSYRGINVTQLDSIWGGRSYALSCQFTFSAPERLF